MCVIVYHLLIVFRGQQKWLAAEGKCLIEGSFGLMGLWGLKRLLGKKSDECRALRKRFFLHDLLRHPVLGLTGKSLISLFQRSTRYSYDLWHCIPPAHWRNAFTQNSLCSGYTEDSIPDSSFPASLFFSHLFGEVITWSKKTLSIMLNIQHLV